MGRVKLKIKRLENTNGRQATYAKRKHGIMKKANELSILCDIDIILLMFSPTGKPSLCSGKRSSIEEVIAKFAHLTPQERAKRKLESLEALKKTFKKLDHDVNIQEFLGTSPQTIEQLSNQAWLYHMELSELQKRLSCWTNPEKINSVEHLDQMENSLRESLNGIGRQKDNLQKQQLMSLECASQFQNGIRVPFRMGAEQHLQPLSWISNNDSQRIILPEDPNLLPQQDMEGSGSSSFGSHSGYFSMGKTSEMSNSGQENGIVNELSKSLPMSLHPMSLQLGGQIPYLPYNLNVLTDVKFQPPVELNPAENLLDYHANENFEFQRPGYDTNQHSWDSTSGPCGVSMFDEELYSQSPYSYKDRAEDSQVRRQ
uniref:MADS46 n=1 Tax=Hippophae rhamnoides TaxID=193516 RepID=A0AAU7LJE1_9ROSA